jgi:hypothetical protein
VPLGVLRLWLGMLLLRLLLHHRGLWSPLQELGRH